MTDHPERKKAKCLCIDIETSRQDRLGNKGNRRISARHRRGDAHFRQIAEFRAKLNNITQGAAFVLGIIFCFRSTGLGGFSRSGPASIALGRYPGTIADGFSAKSLHRLVKDYKLCTTTRNDPVRDAELAYELFLDQARLATAVGACRTKCFACIIC